MVVPFTGLGKTGRRISIQTFSGLLENLMCIFVIEWTILHFGLLSTCLPSLPVFSPFWARSTSVDSMGFCVEENKVQICALSLTV